jgi:hypothetical protein
MIVNQQDANKFIHATLTTTVIKDAHPIESLMMEKNPKFISSNNGVKESPYTYLCQ